MTDPTAPARAELLAEIGQQPPKGTACARLPLSARLALYSTIEPLTGCVLWRASTGSEGYGLLRFRGRTRYAHRMAYELTHGPIPRGLQLDHICRVRGCINPDHLEVVTSRENTRRGRGPSARNAVKTHCPQGHAYSPENTYWAPTHSGKPPKRTCRTCMAARTRLSNEKRRLAALDAARQAGQPEGER